MSERDVWCEGAGNDAMDVEQLLRAAGDYVEVSADLRPRTLETARAHARERLGRWRLSWIALVACWLVVAGSTLLVRVPPTRRSVGAAVPVFLNSSDELYAIASLRAATRPHRDVNWRLVEAFQELRREQSRLIR